MGRMPDSLASVSAARDLHQKLFRLKVRADRSCVVGLLPPGDQPLMVLSTSDDYLGTCVADDTSFEPASHSYVFIGLGKFMWPALCRTMMVELVEMPFAEIGEMSRRSEMDLRDYFVHGDRQRNPAYKHQ
jgi:hypothetical protein